MLKVSGDILSRISLHYIYVMSHLQIIWLKPDQIKYKTDLKLVKF